MLSFLERYATVPLVATALAATFGGGIIAASSQQGEGAPQDRRADASSPAPSPTPTPPSPRPTARAGPLSLNDLEGRLGPPGPDYRMLSDQAMKLGDVNLDELIKRQSLSAEDQEFSAAGFRLLRFERARGHGYSSDDAIVTIVVLRFATAKGAADLVRFAADGAVGRFKSRTVPGAFAQVLPDKESFSVQTGIFANGRFGYEVTVATLDPDKNHAIFDEVLRRQFARARTAG